MQFPIQLGILGFIFKGLLIRIITSAPMGPVGILCVQRTLNKEHWYGFITGIGAAISGTIYILIVGLGMSFIMRPLESPTYKLIVQITGSVLLLLFGICCFKSGPMKKARQNGREKGSLFHNGVTAFLVTLSNPMIIFLSIASYTQFTFVQPNHPLEMIIGLACIPAGASLWWYDLPWLIDKIRGKFDVNGILITDKVIGSVVILFSIIMLVGTVFNLYHLLAIDELIE